MKLFAVFSILIPCSTGFLLTDQRLASLQPTFKFIPNLVSSAAVSLVGDTLFSNPFDCLKKVADDVRTCDDFILSRGFNYETHFVTTQDGYILKMYRIINPNARTARGERNLPPVLLQHGLLNSCSCWMFNSEGEGIVPWINGQRPNVTGNNLGFLLANLGYDVWLANNRGNRYSRNHTTLNPDRDLKFWQFSFDEMARYDLPAEIDYILLNTGYSKLGLVGFSQGTLQTMILLSIRPEYSQKIYPFIALAPVFYMSNMDGIIGTLPNTSLIYNLGKLMKGECAFPFRGYSSFASFFCSLPGATILCSSFMNIMSGTNSLQVNQSRVSTYTAQVDKTSWQNLFHFLQVRGCGDARRYDYGPVQNYMSYGSAVPPSYPIQNIDSPYMVFISGFNDFLANPIDVQRLKNSLRVKPLYELVVDNPNWTHMDFLYAKDTYKSVNRYVVAILDRMYNLF